MSTSLNVLLIMTDEERYTPPYERDALADFRRTRMPARTSLAARGLELHHHYAGSTACAPSRATLFTGQYPSLHGVCNTDGLAKMANDPAMSWLDPDEVPTLGDWFRAAGYKTHYRGKWHVSHADLLVPGTHDAFMTNTREGDPIAEGVDAYRATDRLEPFGFSGWIGPEPHGAPAANTGMARDHLIADQVIDLLGSFAARSDEAPWLAVASFVNPHDIGFSGLGWQMLGFEPVPDWVPAVPEAPSQSDSLDDRPDCQAQWRSVFPKMLYDQPADLEYRRLYHYLMAVVDEAIGRVLASLEDNGLADDTIVVFTSDHGDLLGAHGGLQQKWYNAYDEAIHVPMIVAGPGIDADGDGDGDGDGPASPTSHIDLVPTLLGLIGHDPVELIDAVGAHHTEAHPLPGRDLSGVLRGTGDIAPDPIYFMTEDQMSSGLRTVGALTQTPFEPVAAPSSVESVIAPLDGSLWKLNHYYDAGGTTDAEDWELHDLSADPGERDDRSGDSASGTVIDRLRSLLDSQRLQKRLGPTERRTPG